MIRAYLDVADMFKTLHVTNKNASDYLAKTVLGKNICKINNVGDWGTRPLRNSQLHHAACGAYLKFLILEKLEKHPDYEDEVMYLESLSV